MGVMGHFIGDGSQPLHTTIHYNGWAGANTNGYTTNRSFHSWIDGGYFKHAGGVKAEGLLPKVHPAELVGKPEEPESFFRAVVAYIQDGNSAVEPLYRLEKEGKLAASGDISPEGKAFLEGQLVKGAQMLGNIWLTAWQNATEDRFLKAELEKRRAGK
jgi:hypothetical protein